MQIRVSQMDLSGSTQSSSLHFDDKSANSTRSSEHEEAILKSVHLSTPRISTHLITLSLTWNLHATSFPFQFPPLIGLSSNGHNGPTRVPASYFDHNIPSEITVVLSDNYRSVTSTTLLVDHSEYFFRCLDGNWKEAAKQDIMLDFPMAPWCIFRNWLETGIVTSEPPVTPGMIVNGFQNTTYDWDSWACRSSDECKISIERLTQAWILGDYLIAPLFQNNVIDELTCAYQNLWHYKSEIPWCILTYTCQNTLASSPLQIVVLDIIRFCISTNHMKLDSDIWSLVERCGFTATVQRTISQTLASPGVQQPAPWNRTRTFYHIKPQLRL